MWHWIQRHRLLCLVCLVGILIVAAFTLLVIRASRFEWVHALSSVLLVGALVGMGYVVGRWIHFKTRLVRLLRLLLEGKYESGIKRTQQGLDEVGALERMLDKLTEQLRTYDYLRAERVRQCQRLLTVLLENMLLPVMLFDVSTEMFQCNPAWRARMGVDKETISFKALKSVDTNGAFMELLTQTLHHLKTPQEGQVPLQFPAQDDKPILPLRILPLKDNEETVFAALILENPHDR
ncbi:hypothetical protein ACFL6U_06220 [Planctomycetota bacterium]